MLPVGGPSVNYIVNCKSAVRTFYFLYHPSAFGNIKPQENLCVAFNGRYQ